MTDARAELFPYLCIKDAAAAMDFYKKAFGAKEHFRFEGKDGEIGHATMEILGATSLRPVEDQPYGDRSGVLADPFGHRWFISSHIEDVSTEELEKRMTDYKVTTRE